MATLPQKELILAAATTSTGGLGKVGVVLATTGTLLVRCPNEGPAGRTEKIDWRVKSDQAWGYTLFRSHDLPTATITMAEATRVDDQDTFVLDGLTYTAETTAADAAYASRKWKAGGTAADDDVVALTALLNADYAIVPDGSVTVGDTIIVTTTDDAGGSNTYTYTAAAAPSYASRVFDQSGNQAAELASIVLALNHKRNVTLASCAAGTTISFIVENGVKKTYTAHATTTTAASRQFSIAGTNSQDGDELVTCLNDATYGLGAGYTAVNAAGVVSITRNYASAPDVVISSSNSTTAACVNSAGGVPGIVAAATGATGELAITPTWVKSLVVSASPVTHITVTDIDCPGILATADTHTVTLTPGTPGSPKNGEQAYVIQFGQGTSDANEIAFAYSMTSFGQDGAAVTGKSANSTTCNGELLLHTVRGWEHAYLLYANGAGSDATVTIAATKY